MSEIQVFRGEDGWYWHLKAGNGEILAASESYTRKVDAHRGAREFVAAVFEAAGAAARDGTRVV